MTDSQQDDSKYEPDHLGRYKVDDVGRANPHLRAAIGNTPLQAIGAKEGDYIIVEETELNHHKDGSRDVGLLITLDA